jgi:hypothetical protein
MNIITNKNSKFDQLSGGALGLGPFILVAVQGHAADCPTFHDVRVLKQAEGLTTGCLEQ